MFCNACFLKLYLSTGCLQSDALSPIDSELHVWTCSFLLKDTFEDRHWDTRCKVVESRKYRSAASKLIEQSKVNAVNYPEHGHLHSGGSTLL